MSTRNPDGVRRRRRGAVAAFLAALILPVFQGSAPAQVAPDKAAQDCREAPPETRDACLASRDAIYALQTVAILPSARIDRDYRRQVVSGGQPPYALDPSSRLPDGLTLTPKGWLVGRPTRLGRQVVMLVVRDSAGVVTRGHYSLLVYKPRPVAPPVRPIKPVEPPLPPPVQLPTPSAPMGQIAIWSLSQGDLKALAAPTPPAPQPEPPPSDPPAAAADAPPPFPGERSDPAIDPTPSEPPFALSEAQARRLQAIVDLEYPTLALFKAAVRARLETYAAHAPLDPYKAAPTAGAAPVRIAVPEPIVDILARKAYKPQDFRRAPRARLDVDPKCGCVPPPPTPNIRRTVGFFPFWRPTQPGQEAQFSLFDRIEVMGAQLQTDMTWLTPSSPNQSEGDWTADMNRLAIDAQAHGARLELVLHGADWNFLPRDEARLRLLAKTAATNALQREDIKISGIEPLFRDFLFDPLWKTRPHRVFDGVTVMFEPPPPGSPNSAAFETFFQVFVTELVQQANARRQPVMVVKVDELDKSSKAAKGSDQPRTEGLEVLRRVDAQGRPFSVNIVAPYDPDPKAQGTLFRPGPFEMRKLLGYLHMQSYDQTPPLADEEKPLYARHSIVQVRLMVLLPSPTTSSKKALRADVDRAENLHTNPHSIRGPNRLSLTNWMIPVLFAPMGPTPAPGEAPGKAAPSKNPEFNNRNGRVGAAGESDDFSMDLFYARENFGGFGAWPIPIQNADEDADVGAGAFVNEEAARIFFEDRRSAILWNAFGILPICSTPWRLTWQLLVLLTPLGLLVATFADLSPRRRRLVLLATGVCAVAAGLLGFFLLQVDPALDQIKRGNGPFLATLLALAAGAAWFFFRPRIRRP